MIKRKCPFKMMISKRLEELGVEHKFARRGNHPFVVMSVPTGEKKLFFPGSTSDNARAVKNVSSQLRKMLRDGGVHAA